MESVHKGQSKEDKSKENKNNEDIKNEDKEVSKNVLNSSEALKNVTAR